MNKLILFISVFYISFAFGEILDVAHRNFQFHLGQPYDFLNDEFKHSSCVAALPNNNKDGLRSLDFTVNYKNNKITSYEEIQKNSSLFVGLDSAFKVNLAKALSSTESNEVVHLQISISRPINTSYSFKLTNEAQDLLIENKDIVKFFKRCGIGFIVPQEEGYIIDVISIIHDSQSKESKELLAELNYQISDLVKIQRNESESSEPKEGISTKIDIDALNKLLKVSTKTTKKLSKIKSNYKLDFQIKVNIAHPFLKTIEDVMNDSTEQRVANDRSLINGLNSDANMLFEKVFIDFPNSVTDEIIKREAKRNFSESTSIDEKERGLIMVNEAPIHPITKVRLIGYSEIFEAKSNYSDWAGRNYGTGEAIPISAKEVEDIETILYVYKRQLDRIKRRRQELASLKDYIETSLKIDAIAKKKSKRVNLGKAHELIAALQDYNDRLGHLCLKKSAFLANCSALSSGSDYRNRTSIASFSDLNFYTDRHIQNQVLLGKEVKCVYRKDMRKIRLCIENNFSTRECKRFTYHKYVPSSINLVKDDPTPSNNGIKIEGKCVPTKDFNELQLSQPVDEIMYSNI